MGLPTALEAELNEQSALAGRARASFELTHAQRPSTLYQPRLSIDGNMWCALFGVDLQDGVAGFGKSPELALQDFDKNWCLQWTPRTRGTCGECEFGRFTNGKREGCGCGKNATAQLSPLADGAYCVGMTTPGCGEWMPREAPDE